MRTATDLAGRTVCVMDQESWPTLSGHSRIFNATVMAVKFRKKNGVNVSTGLGGFHYNVMDVIADDRVNLIPQVRTRMSDAVVEVAKRNDIEIFSGTFAECFAHWNQFIADNGNAVIGHSLENDAKMLLDTQNFLGSKVKVIKQKYLQFMNSDKGTYDKNHAGITKICSERMLKERAPRFKRNFHKEVDARDDISMTYKGCYPSNLDAYTKVTTGDDDYVQSHNSVKDTLDLIEVVKSAIAYDGIGIIGDSSYCYQTKRFDRPVSNPSV